jgi:hypothetical protein
MHLAPLHLALYAIWFLVPAFFLVLALWSKMEHLASRGERGRDAADLARQGVFVLVAACLCLAIDTYVFLPHVEPILPTWLPIGVLEVAIFPLILVLQALIVGPSKNIAITSRQRKIGSSR